MQRVRTRNTAPELAVRKMLHRMGYRFRLHRKELPGSPDIVLVKMRVAIFVHGCFWHGHSCKRGRPPSTNQEFWKPKLEKNKNRDEETIQRLIEIGWQPIVIWECELSFPDGLEDRIVNELSLQTVDESMSVVS